MDSGDTTRDINEIKRWAKEREGVPAMVSNSLEGDTDILRIKFSDDSENLRPVSWDEWQEVFDREGLAFLYQETLATGETSRFFRVVSAEDESNQDSPS